MSETLISVLVVCLGNICRSPMGEAVLAHVVKERGLNIKVDSAGTAGYHVGEEPDERTVATCRKHTVSINHEARQVTQNDFYTFTHILASDTSNLANLERMKPVDAKAVIRLWGSYDDGKPIQDPYYGEMVSAVDDIFAENHEFLKNGFEKAYQQCLRYSEAFLDEVVPKSKTGQASL